MRRSQSEHLPAEWRPIVLPSVDQHPQPAENRPNPNRIVSHYVMDHPPPHQYVYTDVWSAHDGRAWTQCNVYMELIEWLSPRHWLRGLLNKLGNAHTRSLFDTHFNIHILRHVVCLLFGRIEMASLNIVPHMSATRTFYIYISHLSAFNARTHDKMYIHTIIFTRWSLGHTHPVSL